MVMHARKKYARLEGFTDRHPSDGGTGYSKEAGRTGRTSMNSRSGGSGTSTSTRYNDRYNKSSEDSDIITIKRRRNDAGSPSFSSPPRSEKILRNMNEKERGGVNSRRNEDIRQNSRGGTGSSGGVGGSGGRGGSGAGGSGGIDGGSGWDGSGGAYRESIPPNKSRDVKDDKTEGVSEIVWGDWSEQISSSGKRYFYNCKTEVSQWERPKGWILSETLSDSQRSIRPSRSTEDSKDKAFHQTAMNNSSSSSSSSHKDWSRHSEDTSAQRSSSRSHIDSKKTSSSLSSRKMTSTNSLSRPSNSTNSNGSRGRTDSVHRDSTRYDNTRHDNLRHDSSRHDINDVIHISNDSSSSRRGGGNGTVGELGRRSNCDTNLYETRGYRQEKKSPSRGTGPIGGSSSRGDVSAIKSDNIRGSGSSNSGINSTQRGGLTMNRSESVTDHISGVLQNDRSSECGGKGRGSGRLTDERRTETEIDSDHRRNGLRTTSTGSSKDIKYRQDNRVLCVDDMDISPGSSTPPTKTSITGCTPSISGASAGTSTRRTTSDDVEEISYKLAPTSSRSSRNISTSFASRSSANVSEGDALRTASNRLTPPMSRSSTNNFPSTSSRSATTFRTSITDPPSSRSSPLSEQTSGSAVSRSNNVLASPSLDCNLTEQLTLVSSLSSVDHRGTSSSQSNASITAAVSTTSRLDNNAVVSSSLKSTEMITSQTVSRSDIGSVITSGSRSDIPGTTNQTILNTLLALQRALSQFNASDKTASDPSGSSSSSNSTTAASSSKSMPPSILSTLALLPAMITQLGAAASTVNDKSSLVLPTEQSSANAGNSAPSGGNSTPQAVAGSSCGQASEHQHITQQAIQMLQKLQQALVAQQQQQQQRQLQQLLLSLLSVQKLNHPTVPAVTSAPIVTSTPLPAVAPANVHLANTRLDPNHRQSSSANVGGHSQQTGKASESPYSPPDSDGTPLGTPEYNRSPPPPPPPPPASSHHHHHHHTQQQLSVAHLNNNVNIVDVRMVAESPMSDEQQHWSHYSGHQQQQQHVGYNTLLCTTNNSMVQPSTASQPVMLLGTSQLAAATTCLRKQDSALAPSLGNYVNNALLDHVTGWPTEIIERQANCYVEEENSVSSLLCSQVSVELKRARSLVRVDEIHATLQEQRVMFLRQQQKDLEKSSSSSYLSSSNQDTL